MKKIIIITIIGILALAVIGIGQIIIPKETIESKRIQITSYYKDEAYMDLEEEKWIIELDVEGYRFNYYIPKEVLEKDLLTYVLAHEDEIIAKAKYIFGDDVETRIEFEKVKNVIPSGETGKVVCIKSDGNLGTCLNQPNKNGVCNCG